MDFDLTVKNYRCFEDTHPARITIGRGLTAFVGPNGAGKSSILKLIFEFRNIWPALANNWLVISPQETASSYVGVVDQAELYCDHNDRPLTLDVEPNTLVNTSPHLEGVTITAARNGRLVLSPKNSVIKHIHPVQVQRHINGQLYGGLQIQSLELQEISRHLCNSMYIGPYRGAIGESAGRYYDLDIGSSFIESWHDWSTGPIKKSNIAAEKVSNDIRSIFGFERLDIYSALGNKSLQVKINGKPYKLHELGAGIQQFITVFINAAVRQPSYILIDEPELHLHPSLQMDFLTRLATYASEGVIFSTHSIGLARAAADRIYSFQLIDGRSHVKPFEATPNYTEFVGEMSYSSLQQLGCDRILLVEGGTDIKTMRQFLRFFRKDHKTVVLSLGGNQLARGGVEQELNELKRLATHVSAVVDSERLAQGASPKKEREDFANLCQSLRIPYLLTERRATENYFPQHAIEKALGPPHTALGPFETLRDVTHGWAKADNWRIANRMTKDDLAGTDIGAFLEGPNA